MLLSRIASHCVYTAGGFVQGNVGSNVRGVLSKLHNVKVTDCGQHSARDLSPQGMAASLGKGQSTESAQDNSAFLREICGGLKKAETFSGSTSVTYDFTGNKNPVSSSSGLSQSGQKQSEVPPQGMAASLDKGQLTQSAKKPISSALPQEIHKGSNQFKNSNGSTSRIYNFLNQKMPVSSSSGLSQSGLNQSEAPPHGMAASLGKGQSTESAQDNSAFLREIRGGVKKAETFSGCTSVTYDLTGNKNPVSSSSGLSQSGQKQSEAPPHGMAASLGKGQLTQSAKKPISPVLPQEIHKGSNQFKNSNGSTSRIYNFLNQKMPVSSSSGLSQSGLKRPEVPPQGMAASLDKGQLTQSAKKPISPALPQEIHKGSNQFKNSNGSTSRIYNFLNQKMPVSSSSGLSQSGLKRPEVPPQGMAASLDKGQLTQSAKKPISPALPQEIHKGSNQFKNSNGSTSRIYNFLNQKMPVSSSSGPSQSGLKRPEVLPQGMAASLDKGQLTQSAKKPISPVLPQEIHKGSNQFKNSNGSTSRIYNFLNQKMPVSSSSGLSQSGQKQSEVPPQGMAASLDKGQLTQSAKKPISPALPQEIHKGSNQFKNSNGSTSRIYNFLNQKMPVSSSSGPSQSGLKRPEVSPALPRQATVGVNLGNVKVTDGEQHPARGQQQVSTSVSQQGMATSLGKGQSTGLAQVRINSAFLREMREGVKGAEKSSGTTSVISDLTDTKNPESRRSRLSRSFAIWLQKVRSGSKEFETLKSPSLIMAAMNSKNAR
ncbi:hypothetical protein [Erwinia pyrifoliae]|uniref:hypothetical protein n=1 Tax=Erwinia pyrifoliae TaxID=79967 RepID=UPI0021FB2E3C|nr:hypothetical protein [Erwinia pyrifoliae]UWS29206.1 hypothetical protein NYP81_15040 [Erwinia pyrifoliae]